MFYKIVHGCEFNKNGSFSSYEGIYAWLQILKRDLHGNELKNYVFDLLG